MIKITVNDKAVDYIYSTGEKERFVLRLSSNVFPLLCTRVRQMAKMKETDFNGVIKCVLDGSIVRNEINFNYKYKYALSHLLKIP